MNDFGATVTLPRPRGLAPMLGWRRLSVTLGATLLIYLPMSLPWKTSLFGLLLRMVGVALLALLAFGPGQPVFWRDPLRLSGFMMLSFSGLLVAPWVALGALVRQREAFAREQALSFELERSRLEHQALDARMRLLQAQVQPHFLFNTLANVRALVNTGSRRAGTVLDSLIAYLRGAVPRLDEQATTLGQEAELVRAYLDLMQLRMPDRLGFTIDVAPEARACSCPPMTLMTLVENAVRHGIDPAEEGGHIDVRVEQRADRIWVCVNDTGVGLRDASGGSLGTGLAALRERLQLIDPAGAQLRVTGVQPRGVRVELEFVAQLQQGRGAPAPLRWIRAPRVPRCG